MSDTTCLRFHEDLVGLLEGTASESLKEHVATCDSCRDAAARARERGAPRRPCRRGFDYTPALAERSPAWRARPPSRRPMESASARPACAKRTRPLRWPRLRRRRRRPRHRHRRRDHLRLRPPPLPPCPPFRLLLTLRSRLRLRLHPHQLLRRPLPPLPPRPASAPARKPFGCSSRHARASASARWSASSSPTGSARRARRAARVARQGREIARSGADKTGGLSVTTPSGKTELGDGAGDQGRHAPLDRSAHPRAHRAR